MVFSRVPSVTFGATLILAAVFSLSGCKSEAGSEAKAADTASSGLSADFIAGVAKKFSDARPDLSVSDVQTTEVEGIYQVVFEDKGSVYWVDKGDYFFVGDLFQIQGSKLVNIKAKQSNGPRKELIASINKDDMIVFSPKGDVKASVAIFTDVDCGYCRKLHQEVPRLNEMGIEVKYLAYPRAGIGSPSYDKIASAWCAEDRNDAISKLKNGQSIPIEVCDNNPVESQFNIGIRAGLTGTPAIVLESGELIPGYLPAEQLAKTIGI